MAQGKISAKQEEILEYIKSQILERGFPPSVRDICEAVHLKSTSSVHSHLETLEKNGYIHRDPTKPRAIEILDDSFNFNRREMVNVPVIGHVAAGEPLLAEQNIENYFPIPMEYMPNMADVRQLAFRDIDECLYRILKDSLVYLDSKNITVDPMTQRTYDYYKKEMGKED